MYDRSGRLVSLTNDKKQTTRLYYHDGKLGKVIGPFSKTLQLSYQNNKVVKAVGALGTVTYSYVGGLLSSVTKVDGSTIRYQYEGEQLTGVLNALGQKTVSYEYDNQGRVVNSAGQDGSRKTTFNYSNSGVLVKNIANNATDSYVFTIIRGVMRLASITGVDGSTQTQKYDANGYPVKAVAQNGSITLTDYDRRGLLVSLIGSAGTDQEKITTTQWHKKFRKPVKRIEEDQATLFTYNGKGLLVKRIVGMIKHDRYWPKHHHKYHREYHHHRLVLENKRITRFQYNSKSQLIKTIEPNGAITQKNYDNAGNLASSSNALGQENKTLSFDATGKPLVSQDANGIQTKNQYDSAGRLTSTITNGQTTAFEYDVAGRQTKVINSDGSTTQSEYDRAGNLVKTIDQDGNVTVSTFDSNSNQTSNQVTDDKGNVILSSTSEYDNKNQLVKSTDAQGNITIYTYDTSGNQIKITDAKGNQTQNEYDEQNRLVKSIDATGGIIQNTYDLEGNRTKFIAPNGATTTFEYDGLNQLSKEISPDRGATTYEYDDSGNQIQMVDANGNTHHISYDLLNRKTGESWDSHPDLAIAYEYDTCRIGSLCQTTDKSGSTLLAYDSNSQIIQKDRIIDGTTLRLKYSYNSDKKLTSVTYPSGKIISFEYDFDKIIKINVDGSPLITGISYNAANQLTGWKWSDGTPYLKTYDVNGRLKTFPLASKTRTLVYDALGNVTGWNDTGSDEFKTFGYDDLSRLTSYKKADDNDILQSQLFSYDANGNRLKLDDDNIQTIYSILENSNRLREVGTIAYKYDNNGNIIDDGEHTYSYDARNRLTNVDGTTDYLYNANNMRVKKTTPTGTVLYGWDNDRIFAEYDNNGSPLQETVYLGSIPIAILKDNQTYRIFVDQVNSPRVITDNTNTALWTWDSKPFGESFPDEDADKDGTSLTYNLRFPGQYYDEETDKHYNFNRDYNPFIGRYTQSDPIGLGGGNNTYVYALLNPAGLIDSMGLEVEDDPTEDHWWLFWAHFGTQVHNEFTRQIRSRPGYGANDTNGGIFGTGRPDAYRNSTRELWELKPSTWASGSNRTRALAQLQGYIDSAILSGQLWSKGNSSTFLSRSWSVIFWEDTHYEIEFFPDTVSFSGLVFYKKIAEW